MAKKVHGVYTGTNAQLEQLERKFASSRLVLNLTTGEIRKGPGKWRDMTPLGSDDIEPDVTVAAVSATNVTIASGLNAGDTVGGVELEAGDLVLVMGQSDAKQNGIYVAGTTPARADKYSTFKAHAGVIVKDADGNLYRCTVGVSGELGEDNITFVPFTAGAALLPNGSGQLAAMPAAGTLANANLVLVEQGGVLRKVSLQTLKTFMTA